MAATSFTTPLARRFLTAVLAALVLLGLALLPASAHASGCTNSWIAKGSGSWYTAANWSKKLVPSSEEEVCITENGTGNYTVEMDQGTSPVLKSLTIGGTEHTATLVVASTNSANANLDTTAGVTVTAHGALVLTNSETSGNNVQVTGPVENAGTITTEVAHGGARTFSGNVTNTGTLAINASTGFTGTKAALVNEGSIDVATGVDLNATNESTVKNASGKIEGAGTGFVNIEPGGTFTEGSGTIVGAKPVVVRDGNISYTGSGAGLISKHGESGTLSGNISSGQTLAIESTNSENAAAAAAVGFTNAGTITLTNSETSPNNARLTITTGTLSNTGTINIEKVNGGARTLQGNITNTGTINVNQNAVFNVEGTVLANEGNITVAAGLVLNATSKSKVSNLAGKISAGAGGYVNVEPEGTFTQGGGAVVGTKPVIVRDGNIAYSGAGAGLITKHGESGSLSGNISSGQTLVIESTNGENAAIAAPAGFTNAGTITLTNSEVNANNARLTTSAGTLTNSGTINIEKDVGGARTLQGNITNTGTINVNQNAVFNVEGTVLANEGNIDIAAGIVLNATSKSTISNVSGKITAGEGGYVNVEPEGTFNQGGGADVGARPVIVRDANIVYSGSGAGLITKHGEGGSLSGNISSGQTLVIESTNGENASATASASFTNAGTITLGNSETNANAARLAISAGTLTSSGTIDIEKDVGGARTLQGNITNTGTINVNQSTTFSGTEATLTNKGNLNVATGLTLSTGGGVTIANETGGVIDASGTGTVLVVSSTFVEGAGKVPTAKGTEAVVVRDGTLTYTGTGASKIQAHGTVVVNGNVSKGQTLIAASTNGENALLEAPAAFSNSGTVTLTNVETNPNNAAIRLGTGTGTFENKGKLELIYPDGGSRTVEGTLDNTKTLTLGNSTNAVRVSGGFTQGSKGSLTTSITGSGNYGRILATGALSLAGKMTLKQVKFTAKSGESFAFFSGSARTGEFSLIKGTAIKGGSLSYVPHYTATGLNLVVE